jgi:hypothetical protein
VDLRTRRELTALRLAAQRISTSPSASPADTVRWMLALQAQDLPGARWAVGLRTPGATDRDVRAALASGEIVRSWPLRGTLHLVAPDDLGWMLELTRPRQRPWAATRRRDLGITDDELARATDVAHRVLEGGPMRRDLLLAEFEAAGIPTANQWGYHLLWNLAHEAVTVFGPPDGDQPTFALFGSWISSHRALEPDEALGEFARRYASSHGPATDRDFAWWTSLTLTQARRGLDIAGLPSIERDGRRFFHAPDLAPASNATHLLPGFDEFLLGYQDRSAPLAAEHSERIVPGKNGVFLPTIVTNGVVTGTWRRTVSRTAVAVELDPFTTPSASAAQRERRAVDRYARFLGVSAVTR